MTLKNKFIADLPSQLSSPFYGGMLSLKKSLLILGLFVSVCSSVIAQPLPEKDLYKKLTAQDSGSALESVLKTPDEYSARILYASAGVAFKENHLEDSGFLFYAAKLRAEFDQTCFLAKDKVSSSPTVLYGVRAESVGNQIYPAITANPKVFAKVVSRLRSWKPKATYDYVPGYNFWSRKTEKEAYEINKPKRNKFINSMSDLSVLLNDANYFAAFQVIQASNRTTSDPKPTKEAVAKATETMKRIETMKRQKGDLTD